MATYKDDEGNLYIDTDPDDDWSGEKAAEAGDPDAGYTDSGGRSSSGGSSSSSSDSSSSSSSSSSDADSIDQPDSLFSQYQDDDQQYQDKDSDGIPDSKESSVVVTGGGGSGEKQEVVGTGSGADSEAEAQAYAATNENFDADEGTQVDNLEEIYGTDQEEINPNDDKNTSSAVTVTGDPSDGEEQRVVGQGDTVEQSIASAALNQRFDADEGTRVDRYEERLQMGQGDGTQPPEPQRSPEPTDQENNTRRTAAQNQQSRSTEDYITDIETFLNPLEGNPDQTPAEEALTAGIDLMQEGQEFGEDVADLIPRPGEGKQLALDISTDIAERFDIGTEEDRENAIENFNRYWPEAPAKTSGASEGIALLSTGADAASDGDISREDLIEIGREKVLTGTEESVDAREDIVSGVATGGTQVAGLALAAGGGTVRATREDTPDLLEGAAAGPALTAEQVAEDPGEFVASEIGEEIGEKLVFGTLTGGAGLAVSSVATPEFTPEVEPTQTIQADIDSDSEPVQEFDPVRTEEATTEIIPSGFMQEQDPETNVREVRTDQVEELVPGAEIRRAAEGPRVYPDQPRAENFNFEVGEDTAEARARPTEPDPVQDPGEFRGEDPRTGYTDVEQEVVREVRGREDVTIRQGETVEERGPGLNQPDPEQTVIEAEETETGGEMFFSSLFPMTPGMQEVEPETEINPQPDIQGPEPDLADVEPDTDITDVGPEIGLQQGGSPETEIEINPEPDVETEIDPEVGPVVDQRPEQELDPMREQTPGQEQGQEQIPEIVEEPEQIQEPGTPEPEPGPDKIMDFPQDRNPEPEFFPETTPRPEGSPEPGRDGGREDSPFFTGEDFQEEETSDADPEFNPSLGAVLFDITSEETPADDQIFTGTEVRPIPEDMEEEFDLPF